MQYPSSDRVNRVHRLSGPRALIARASRVVTAAAVASVAVFATTQSSAQTSFRLWNIHPEGYPVTIALNSFAADVKAKTDGRVNVQVYSNAVLGDQPKAVSMLKSGELDMGEFGLGPLTEAVPSMKAITLPFLFKDPEHMFRHMDGALGDKFRERLAAAGFVVLGWYDGGGRSFYCVNKRLQGPRDFAGLRIRVQGTEIFKEMITLMGATPTIVPYKDVKAAFEEDKIDCAENNLPSFVSAGHYKHAKYFFLTNHVVSPEALVVSTAAWKKISAADQAILRTAGQASAVYMRQVWNKQVEEARLTAVKAGIVFDRPIEFGAYVARMKPMHQKYWKDPSTRDELLTILAN